VIDDILYHIPRKLHIVVKVGKCYFGLYHPELCCVTGGIGVLCTEGRTKGVDITKRHSIGFTLKLTGNGEVCTLTEEVLRKINLTVLGFGKIFKVKSGYLI
jgi:hypothetical protein